ncbi:hypothetical protein [Croceicoccus marinus]|uniref:DUF4124 domain-containing protein n=1 Tax=Croceicoccus marinus TaxID=450378 RepID=A0A7G6VUZ0_9SPHN|nr:hypothetical protein [Croceicoccus marinus]QNE05555.1 hypothetical protein H4O24_02315 [Croceicoccus marinus]
MKTTTTLAALAFTAVWATPAAAQDAPNEERVNQVIVYGDQPCPEARDDNEIVVCVRQEDPYRVPKDLRESGAPQNEAWANRVAANADVGATGVGSCSTVGQEGQTGCQVDIIEQAYAEKETADSVRFGELIAEERARRLEAIDADAADEQERVEALEREYEARRTGQAPNPETGNVIEPSDAKPIAADPGE